VRHRLVAGPRRDRLGRDPGLLVQLPQRRPGQGLIRGLGVSAGGENLPTCQVEHVQDAAERVEDDRAAGDMSGEGGAAGDVGGAFEGIQEGAEPTQSGDPSTIERIEQRVRRHIVPHLGAQPLNAIGTEVLRHWKKRLEKDLGPTSIRLVWATLSSILQAAVEDRRLGREAKHRRPRTYSLLVTGRERKAINRNYFNSYGWKPALAEAGVIAPLEEGNTNGARVWEPSREHRLPRPAPLLRLRGTGGRRIGRLPGTLAGTLRPRVHAAEVLPLPAPRGRTRQRRHRRDFRVAVAGRQDLWSVARSPPRVQSPREVPEMPPHPSPTR